jgi:hypothetical protein
MHHPNPGVEYITQPALFFQTGTRDSAAATTSNEMQIL